MIIAVLSGMKHYYIDIPNYVIEMDVSIFIKIMRKKEPSFKLLLTWGQPLATNIERRCTGSPEVSGDHNRKPEITDSRSKQSDDLTRELRIGISQYVEFYNTDRPH
ncbi:hypothetical protein ACFPYJ_00865 [Paenibacillus solisilvae]|uniref:Integrase catalytic domain-containing protein n=1 Tax=Paenibacillus solisilvae TaxID=2486751 RepID=A0ABW0VRV5_9BACL